MSISGPAQVCDPELVASSEDESEMDFVLVTDTPGGIADHPSPAASLLPDSPRGEVPLFEEVRLLEREDADEEEDEELLFAAAAAEEEGDDVELAGTTSGELWPVLSGSSTSSFIVTWDPETSFPADRGPEPSVSRRPPPPPPPQEEWRHEEHVAHAPYIVRLQPAPQQQQLPPPARWIGDAGLVTTSPTTWVRSGWSSPWMGHPRISPPLRRPPTPPRRRLSPPPVLPTREPWGQRTSEEFIPEPAEPLNWRPPRRCFSPCADRLRPAFINEPAGTSADVARGWRYTPHNMF